MSLIDLVFTLYDYRIKKENLINPKLMKNIKVKGTNIEHTIDIYIEFVMMNNLERTIIKTIENQIVTDKDLWQFDNLLKDLGYFAKGVLYYNYKINDQALKIAENRNIQVVYFDVMKETVKNAIQSIKHILPDKNVIGDPFWTLMMLDKKSKNNTGDYFIINDSLPLFTSKKLAEEFCKMQKDCAVFGISQKHLSFLLSLSDKNLCPYNLGIIVPSQQTSASLNYNVEMYNIENKTIREIYVR